MSKTLFRLFYILLFVLVSLRVLAAPTESLEEAINVYNSGNYVAGYQAILPWAQQGNPVAQFYVGVANSWGYGTKVNYTEAESWYRKSATKVDSSTDPHFVRTLHGQLLILGEKRFGDTAAGIQYFLLRADPTPPDCKIGEPVLDGSAPCDERWKMYRVIGAHITPELKEYRAFEVGFFEKWIKGRREN